MQQRQGTYAMNPVGASRPSSSLPHDLSNGGETLANVLPGFVGIEIG